MLWPFSGKKKDLPSKLVFKSGEAFLEYQCKFGHTEIMPKQGIVAVVMDAKRDFGVSQSVKVENDGRQMAMLKIASRDGGFVAPSYTASEKGDRLKPGDVVIWVPLEYTELASKADASRFDPRMGWVGFIVAKIKPELDINKPSFDIVSRYD